MVRKNLSIVCFTFVICLVALGMAEKKETLDLSRVKACFQEQKDRCGDLICEMSTDDLFLVVEQLESNIMDCLETQP